MYVENEILLKQALQVDMEVSVETSTEKIQNLPPPLMVQEKRPVTIL